MHSLRFIENVLRSTLSCPNETSKECIQFLNKTCLKKLRAIYPVLCGFFEVAGFISYIMFTYVEHS